MLKRIPKNLSPELLQVLMAMGHGDEIVLADGNYPAAANAKRLIRADGLQIPELLRSILTLLPLDTYVERPVALMAVTQGDVEPSIWAQYQAILTDQVDTVIAIETIERQTFYARSRQAYAIVATGETALYANIILTKGVVGEGEDEHGSPA